MISVVVPAKDEQDTIVEAIRQIRAALQGIEHEILVVDDGSEDGTAAQARAAGAGVISHPHNLGYGGALKSGINAAQFDTIIITDADGTYPADQMPLLIREYEKGFDMVVGARSGQNYLESALKAPLRVVLRALVEYTTGRKVPDVNSGLRIFSKQRITPYFNHLSNSFSFTTSLTLAYMMNHFFVKYVPIAYHKRTGRTKVHLFRDSMRTLQYIVEAITYYNPLKIFILISGLVVIGSLLSLALAFFSKVTLFYFMGIGGLLMSIQIFCLGLIAVLLRQIMVKE